jgi:hypothetical protein
MACEEIRIFLTCFLQQRKNAETETDRQTNKWRLTERDKSETDIEINI